MIYNGNYTIGQLRELILKAMKSRQEGTNYDFKKEWPTDEKLEKCCLAMLNVLNNKDCFIIVGVEEIRDSATDKVVGYEIKEGLSVKKQKEQNFLNHRASNFYPNPLGRLHLNNVDVDGAIIQVLSMEDRLDKPYMRIDSNGKMNGPIYIRHNESSEGATPKEIEELYKYRLRVNENYWDKFFRYLQDVSGWISNSSISGPECCYYFAQPEYSIKITSKVLKSAEKDMPIFVVDLLYAGTNLLPGFILQFSERKNDEPQCFVPLFVIENHDQRDGIFYNICLIVSSSLLDFKKLDTAKKKIVFEDACMANKISWRDSSN